MLALARPANMLVGEILANDLAVSGHDFYVLHQGLHLGGPIFCVEPNSQANISKRQKFGSTSQRQHPNGFLKKKD